MFLLKKLKLFLLIAYKNDNSPETKVSIILAQYLKHETYIAPDEKGCHSYNHKKT